jgi:hypothetical protein
MEILPDMEVNNYFLDNNGYINVVAKFINKVQFGYECDYCHTKYKKNMEPYKSAKRVIHLHGSNGMLHNRNEDRAMHCNKQRLEKLRVKPNGINIIINDTTQRVS